MTVRAPLNLDSRELERIIRQKSGWIRERQDWVRANYPAPPSYKPGELFLFLGQEYPLQMVENQKAPLIFDQSFQIDSSAFHQARELLLAWYKKQARRIIGERLAVLSAEHRMTYNKLRITSARTRWGSCSSKKTLSFSWRLVMAPPKAIDYVILHELAHLKHLGHSPAFWKTVENLCPDYRAQRSTLRKLGRQLTLE